MIEIPITVLKGDPSPAQNPIPLVPVHQLIDVRQSMVNQQMQQWPREQLIQVTPNLEYPQHKQPEEDLKKDSADESVAHGSVL